VFDLDNKKMASVLSSFQVPIKPEILTKIQNIMDEEEPNIEDISVLISSDVGLSSAILKIINSPLYGMNRRVSKIKQAVVVLGLKTINGLVPALLLKNAFSGEANVFLERFWNDALDIANAMSFLGKLVKNEIPVDMLYSIGLFHDCGIPLLALKYPDYKEILEEANGLNINSVALEEQHYQTDHTVLGYYVATSWHLPKEICQLIALHHDNDYLTYTKNPQAQLMYAVLKIAENLVEKVTRKHESPDWSNVEESVLEVVGLSSTDYIDLEDDFAEHFDK
jgi:HD-like signal output (HDOD) protein